MAQHDYQIDNASGLSVRADINAMAAAIVTNNAGPLEPAVKFGGEWWLDTSVASGPGQLKLRNQQNDAWLLVPIGQEFLPTAGGIVSGDLTVAGIFSNPDYDLMRATRAGPTAPPSPVPGMMWFDTSVSPAVLRIRGVANTAWMTASSTTNPIYTDSVTIAAAGAATSSVLQFTASAETRKIMADSAGNRLVFYGPGDVPMGYLTDAGDLNLPAIGGNVSTTFIRKDSVTISTAAPSGTPPVDGAVWYQVA
jgi:hypothetical protein